MEERVESGEDVEDVGHTVAPIPPPMQLLSTWEVKRVPHNCVTRLCMVTVTRLEVKQSLELNLSSVVVAVAMKTPHRFLRSNEIALPPSGTLDIPLQLTFSLQYPHFLKRGGNVLQIRVQRRKRYRNRAIGGYKTLASGTVEMSQVLQKSYTGEVLLFSEKPPQAVAVVTVGSLTSSPVYLDSQREGSSDEEEDDIAYSDSHGSESDSGEGGEVYRSTTRSHKHKNKAIKPSSRMLRLLGIKSTKTHTADDELMEDIHGDTECAVTFASSISDSEEEEEGTGPSTPPRPTLSPFFDSERCSMISIPNSLRSAEVGSEFINQTPMFSAVKQNSQEDVRPTDSEGKGGGGRGEEGKRKRVWVVGEDGIAIFLREAEERVLVGERDGGVEKLVAQFHPLLDSGEVLSVVVVGEDWLVSLVLQVMINESNIPLILIPTSAGVVSSRVWSLDDSLSFFPLDTDWTQLSSSSSSSSSSSLFRYVESATHTRNMPVAQVLLYRQSSDTSLATAVVPISLPFMFSISVGSLDAEEQLLQQPNSPPSASSTSGSEAMELVIEYWTGKKEREKTSMKVRCVMAVNDEQGLSVTTVSRDKKGKGIWTRKKEKEGESGASIIIITTTQFVCRPANKQDTLNVIVDGMEWVDISQLKVTSITGQYVTIATTNPQTFLTDH